ncbi:hypothetical protein F5X96DRAFT_667877 [Biscogniauxia mediterranea]|nr:hypothetical protein F5X96DRAFT_667877 [Biscogniauxia mediterranea]
MAQPDSTTTPGLRCDCALRFENRRAIYEHVVQTGHLKARTCTPCRKVFRRKIGLVAHQRSSLRHRRMLEASSSTPTTAAVVSPGKPKRTKRGKKRKRGAKKSEVTNETPSKLDSMDEQGGRDQTSKPRQPHPYWFMIRWRKEKQKKKKRLAQAKLMDEARNAAGASLKAPINSGNPTGSTTKPAAKVSNASGASGNNGPLDITESERPPWIGPNSTWNFGSVMYGCFLNPKTLRPLGPPSTEPSTSQAGGASLSQEAEQKKKKKNKKRKSNKKKTGIAAANANENTTTTNTHNTHNNNKAMASSPSPPPPPPAEPPSAVVPPSRDYRAAYPWISPLPGRAIYVKLRGLCLSPQDLQDHECYRVPPSAFAGTTTTPRWLAAPPRDPQSRRRFGVALDCEMVEVLAPPVSPHGQKQRRAELARLCVVDLITGAVLIDALVQPTQPVIDWRTRHSGVSAALLSSSTAPLLPGWPAARAALLRLVDRETIVAGHALHHDLAALGVAHARALDTSTAAARFAFEGRLRRRWGLAALMRDLRGVEIQEDRGGHDCVEDALAARELALLCAREPGRMREWGVSARERFEREERERVERQREKEKGRREKERRERERERERKVREPEVAEVVERMERAEVEGWESVVGGGW